MLEAVLFDLDDTLVIADNDQLMRDYTSRLAQRYADQVSPRAFSKALVDCTMQAIGENDVHTTFIERFTHLFSRTLGVEPDLAIFMDFYNTEYAQLGKWAHPAPGARQAVEHAQARGLKIAVATNPLFPYAAIEKRLAWAKLDDISWDLVTTGEKMHACKPHAAYYLETALHLGVSPHYCLMVGNDPENDLPAKLANMHTYLVVGHDDTRSEALQAFSAAQMTAQSTFVPDYQGTLLELPAIIDRLMANDVQAAE